ncbi:hypothetical protein QBC37DRAFT_472855 [Rhypophila decipiens]|uniref:MARVEL domain-containing protein n=1 Tax=Rhypophila decipiens TaxID=261697 RepID=A0AAN7B8D6_9PEZI|nr:hypothetical protein QBC37DRAFT_472855 [Rhypophila decipiens]
MAEVNVGGVSQQKQNWADPKAAPGSDDPWMVHTPVWHVVMRGLQVFFGFVIVVMAGVLIHGNSLDANAFALVCGLFTWIIVTYALVTEKVASAHKGYNIWAILSLDLFMAILWLASMGANAALRASFTSKVNVTCYNDGSAINSNKCYRKRDGIAVANDAGLAVMSAIAGLSALNWLLFVATLVFEGHSFRLYHKANRTQNPTDNATVEMKAQEAPMLDAQQQHQHQPVAPSYPQYTDQQQYQPQTQVAPPPQPTPSPGPVPSQSPGEQYSGYTGGYSQPQQQPQQPYYEAPGGQPYQQQPQEYPAAGYPQTYNPNTPPAQGQPYYPLAQ